MELTDLAVVTKARLGDADAFRVLVERHSRPLFRLAYRMTGNQHDAEDVVQESFLRAWRQLGRFDERASFGTWLYRIATNCSLDLLRARSRRRERQELPLEDGGPPREFASQMPSPERLAISSQVRVRVSAALAQLSAAEQAAFILRHFEGVSIGEIAKVLGRPNGATRHSVFRAAEKLRRALEPLMDSAK
jgi:RNA polymerase sigma-70 factor (ECF subfamily)